MGYGRGPIPRGRLPVFSVNTEEEAYRLLVLTCPTNHRGQFVAPELAEEQSLENLDRFSDRLQRGWDIMKERE